MEEQAQKKTDELIEMFIPIAKSHYGKSKEEYAKDCALIAQEKVIEAILHSRKCFNGGSEMSNDQLKLERRVKEIIQTK